MKNASVPNERIDQFVSGSMTGDAVNAATVVVKKALLERAMGVVLSHHLNHGPGAAEPQASVVNQRNGKGGKTVLTGDGAGQSRPLEPIYKGVFFDALREKVKEAALVRNKATCLALGVSPGVRATCLACGSRASKARSAG